MSSKVSNSPKHSSIVRVAIICFLIISFIVTINSCSTTEMAYVSRNSLNSGYTGEINKIVLKNGIAINCKGKLIKFEGGSDSTGFVVLSTADTVRSGNNSFSIRWNEQRMANTEIQKIYMEKTESDTTKTVLVILGIAAGAALAYFIALVIAINGANLK